MILDFLAPVGNHLWQSTLFAIAAAILTLPLRKNRAQVRYWLWFAASLKFLVPFSLLLALGGYLRPMTAAPMTAPVVSAVMEQMTQPFSQTLSATDIASTVAAPSAAHDGGLLPMILLSVWACGSLIVAFSWWRRWRTIRAAVREASYMTMVADLTVLSSPSLLEPGAFGIFRPVLLLPEGITDRLTEAQLSAILAHEMCHLRRRDNLTFAVHMVVETLFWFYPPVWWIGARLIEEREIACDEAVLLAGEGAQDYAEGILNVCKFYVESPLKCVSGVTGADLKRRIVRIMSEHVARKLNFSRKLLLTAAGLMAITVPIVFGLVRAAQSWGQSSTDKAAQSIAGTWQGTVHGADRDQRMVVKITKADGGAWKAVLYNIDQEGPGVPANTVTLQGSAVKVSFLEISASYEGKLSSDGKTIDGEWSQGPTPLSLVLTRATPETAWTIPPPPKPMAADADPSVEVATIKPSKPGSQVAGFMFQGRRFSTVNTSLDSLIGYTYGIQPKEIIGAPAWADSDKYDLLVEPDGEGQPSFKQWKVMLQKLLADRFKLGFHHDKRELSVYALVVGKDGPKLTKSDADPNGPTIFRFRGLGVIAVTNATMADFAKPMQVSVMDRPVVDQTGLKGRFDFVLKWTPDETQFAAMGGYKAPAAESADAPPDLFTAIQEQLGLKLESTKAPVDVIVIDHAEKPSPN